MWSLSSICLFLGVAHTATAQVVGAAQGFASGVTGGGSATPVYPETNEELIDLLQSTEPQVIILTKTFEFLGTEGTTTEDGCAPFGTDDPACQLAINAVDWCGDRDPVTVTYDNAPGAPIHVASDKTLLGEGSSGVLSGKGLRFTNDVSNIIVQNVHITNLNPEYVWGGDAFIFHGSDLIWIDHCQTSLIGRQHYVTGFDPNTRITISNSFLDGRTSWSASCNGHHYWNLLLSGAGDEITFQSNYVLSTSGRGPALSGSVLFHAVNSVWSDVDGHVLEGGDNGRGLFEGCFFEDAAVIAGDDLENQIFSASDANRGLCEAHLGRTCLPNGYENSGPFTKEDSGFLGDFAGLSIAPAGSASEARESVPANAGIGHI